MKNALRRRLVLVSAGVLASLMAGVGIVGAAEAEVSPTCSGAMQTEWPGWGYHQIYDAVFSHHGPTTITVPAAIPVGTYDVNTATYDGGPSRGTDATQLFEQLFLEFLDTDGAVIATSATTPDLADLVEEASWAGAVGRVVLDRPAVAVRAHHARVGDYSSTNSLMPVCFGVDPVAAPTTTVTSTTVTSTTVPSTTLVPLSENPSTTVPSVLAIQLAPPAQPVTVTPTFTG